MNISKTISSLSLALAMIGGAVVLTPSMAEAAGNKSAIKKGGSSKIVKKPGGRYTLPVVCHRPAQKNCRM